MLSVKLPTYVKVFLVALVAARVVSPALAQEPPHKETAQVAASTVERQNQTTPKQPMTQGFGENPQMYQGLGHGGVDFKNDCGQPVPSKSVGRVVEVGEEKDNGNFVKVKSYDGVTHIYGHTEGAPPVGTSVKVGDSLGKTNISGHTTGCHEHWGTIYPDGKLKDPLKWMSEPNSCPNLFNVPADWGVQICSSAAKYGADPSLVAAIIWYENRGWPEFDKNVCSGAGACGIAQFTEPTWERYKPSPGAVRNDWRASVDAAANYIGSMKKCADVRCKAIEYNAGGRYFNRPDSELPAETQDYIRGVTDKYAEFKL